MRAINIYSSTMKKLIFLTFPIILFLFSCPLVYPQQSDYKLGRVSDSKTSEPVPYATIRLKNSQFGIYTNAEGDFRILNNNAFQSDSIIISCIGYHRHSIAYDDLKATGMNKLLLVPDIYELKEVRINARRKRLSPELIISRAIRNIKNNNPVKPFSYVSYYRDYLKDSVSYLNLNEAIIQTLDNGFAYPSDSNRYRLLAFRKNMDFARTNITPFYDLPETDHSDESFKRIPFAVVGDQYGNELYILLGHDALRNSDKRTFSFVDTLANNFIRNHWFSEPVGVRDGSNLLYKIEFINKHQITTNVISMKGAIYIQPDDYSIHKLEYSGSYLDSDKKNKEIFSIEIEYGREPAKGSPMYLKYISFNNLFIIPDPNDDNYFRIMDVRWKQDGGPYASYPFPDMTLIANFNRQIDPVSIGKAGNFGLTVGKRTARISRVWVAGPYLYLTVRDDKFQRKELDSCHLSVKTLKDINGSFLNKRKGLEFHQFRELFVQEYNKPLDFKNNCFIQPEPLEQNCISISDNSGRFWMNSPLKAGEK
jgi:hypothetical protein